MGMIIQNGKQYFPVYNDSEIKALPTVDTASGSVATFDTDMTENLVEVVCNIQYSQASGTPTPVNPLPITTYTEMNVTHSGYNRFNPIVYSSFLQPDGKYRGVANIINGIKTYLGAYIGKQMTFSVYADLTVLPTPTYVRVIANVNGTAINGNVINSGDEGYTSVTFTPQSANDYIYITFGSTGGNSYTFYDIQLEEGSARTTYIPFNGTTANIPFGQTVANGVLDVTTGKLTILYGYLVLDGSQPILASNFTEGSSYVQYRFSVIGSDAKRDGFIASNCYVKSSDSSEPYRVLIYYSDGYTRLLFMDARYGVTITNATEWNTWLSNNNVQIVYELDNPITVQLSATQITALLNENNIWCDTGDTEVKFLLTVGKKIS